MKTPIHTDGRFLVALNAWFIGRSLGTNFRSFPTLCRGFSLHRFGGDIADVQIVAI